MIERGPEDYSWLTYTWIAVIAWLAGTVSFIGKVRRGEFRAMLTWGALGAYSAEVVIAMFVAVITFWLCELAGIPKLGGAAITGVFAHMGTRAILRLEAISDWMLGIRMGGARREKRDPRRTNQQEKE